MTDFSIVKGDYGRIYRGIVKNVNYSDCTAKIYVWKGSTKIINGKDCVVSFVSPDTYVDFVPALGAFNVEEGVYSAQIKFLKTGVVESTIAFTFTVLAREPTP